MIYNFKTNTDWVQSESWKFPLPNSFLLFSFPSNFICIHQFICICIDWFKILINSAQRDFRISVLGNIHNLAAYDPEECGKNFEVETNFGNALARELGSQGFLPIWISLTFFVAFSGTSFFQPQSLKKRLKYLSPQQNQSSHNANNLKKTV